MPASRVPPPPSVVLRNGPLSATVFLPVCHTIQGSSATIAHTPQRSSTSRQVCYSFEPRLGQGGQDAYYRSSRFDHGSMVGDLKLGQTTVFASNFWKCGSGLEQRPHDPEDPEAP